MHLSLPLFFKGQVTHMTKTNTTQVIEPPTRAGKAPPPPPLPDHAGSIPGLTAFDTSIIGPDKNILQNNMTHKP